MRNFSCELADCVFNRLLNILGRRLVSLLPGGYSQLVPYILQCFIPNRVSSARRYQCEPYMLNSSWMRTGDSCPYPHIQWVQANRDKYWSGVPLALVVKNLPAKAGDIRDVGSIPGSGRFPWRRACNPLQYSCLENPMDRGSWWATVHGVAESDMTEATSRAACLLDQGPTSMPSFNLKYVLKEDFPDNWW